MTSEKDARARHARVMEAFDAAADLDPVVQRPFLARLAAEDAALAAEVESLLAHDARSSPILAEPGLLALSDQTGTETLPWGDAWRGRDAVPTPGTVLAGRYRIGAVVGVGGSGTVCRARDLEKGADVAVKFLRVGRVQDERGLQRFRREFRAVARLDHPGCVRAFAEGVDGDHRYLVMEYVSGGDLDSLAGAPTDLVLAVLVQLAVSLDYVHSRQIVHRDLKPANVLLVPGNPPVPRIADFGIALLDDEPSWQTENGALTGTVDYLSPEQIEGQPADPRSDLYALGCMIFRLWARRPPFVGSSLARLTARCRQAAPSLRRFAPQAPAGLEELTARLLATDPMDRPQSALEVAGVLAELLVATRSPLAERLLASTSFSAKGAFLYTPGLVGREHEHAKLVSNAHAVAGGMSGEAGFLAVCAEGGMGKTTLCQAALADLVAQGFQAVTVSVPATGAGPLAPFPELRARLQQHTPVDTSPDRRGLHQEGMALTELLRAAHADRPLVVLIEDLHHAAGGSSGLLVQIARLLAETPGPRPVVIATLRPEGRPALMEAAEGGAVAWVDLEPLDATGALHLVATMLGIRDSQLPPGLLDLLLLESDGSPLLLQSALRALVDSGALRRSGGRWLLDGAAAAHASGQTLVDRLSVLSATTRRVLEVAAAIGRRFDPELIQTVLPQSDDALQDAIDEALRAAIIRPVHGSRSERGRDLFEFDHLRLAEALHDGMDAGFQRSCHAALARALAERRAASVVLAHHYVLGGEPLAAFHALRVAGDEALRQYDHAGAARLYREALQQCAALPADADLRDARDDCEEALADALVVTGPIREAVSLLTRLLEAEPVSSLSRVRRLRKLAFARMHADDAAGTMAALEEALATAGDAVPRWRAGMFLRGLRDGVAVGARRLFSIRSSAQRSALIEECARIHRELGQLYRWVDLERSLAHQVASARAAERAGSRELQVDALASVAVALIFVSDKATIALQDLANRLAMSSGDRVLRGRILATRGAIDTVVRGQVDSGLARFDEALQLAQAAGDRMLHSWALAYRGWGQIFAGRLDGARADFDRVQVAAVDQGVEWLAADAACGRSLAECLQGDLDSALGTAGRLLSSELRLTLPAIEALSTEVLGGAAFIRGQYREAAAAFARARSIYEQHHLERGWGYLYELEETDSLLCLVDQDGASAVPNLLPRLLDNARSHQRRLGRLPVYRASAAVLRGIHQARSGHHDQARRLFARAIATRPPGRATYVDIWITWRTAFERARMGDAVSELSLQIDEADRMLAATAMHGMRQWLASGRKLYGI